MEAKIKLTKTMLDKSIIDANKSVQEFLIEELLHSFDELDAGDKMPVPSVYEDDTPTIVTFYKSRTRGDKRISIKNLRKFAQEGDTVKLRSDVVMIEDCIYEVRVVVYKEEAA
tara:strand:+ start:12 stop:350 length:339 start_codon:yes stop_codon:yes gene_type:complete